MTTARSIVEVEVTWARTLRVWWAYVWRSFIGLLVSMLAGFLIGAIATFLAGFMGAPFDAFQNVANKLGALLGLAISVVPMKLILGNRYGDFRLVLVEAESFSNQ